MPSFLPEGNIPLPSDNEKRSLHKVVDLEGGQDAGGGGTVTGTGTVDRVPVWTSASAQGNSYLLQDASGVLVDTGKDLTLQGLGQLLLPDGSAAAPSLAFAGDPNSGLYTPGVNSAALSLGGTARVNWITTATKISSGNTYSWADSSAATSAIDTSLSRIAAGYVGVTSGFRVPDGTAAAPSYSFSGATTAGMFKSAVGNATGIAALHIASAGNHITFGGTDGSLHAGNINVASSSLFLNFTAGNGVVIGSGTLGDGANILAQRNGTAAQAFQIYNTFTSLSNREYGRVGWNANEFSIFTSFDAPGVSRAMQIGTIGASPVNIFTTSIVRWNVSSSGHFLAGTDNTYDIGASDATRPRNVYIGTALYLEEQGSAPGTPSGNQGVIYEKSSDGLLYFKNDAGTEFDLTAGSGNAKTVLFAKTAQTSISTATTASIVGTGSGSATLAAGFFTVGKSIRIVGRGNLSNQATPGNGTLNLKLGATSVSSTGGQSLVANANIPYWFEAIITCRATGASGTVIANIMFSHGATATAYETWAGGVAESTVDTTGTLAVDLEWTFDTGSNTLLSEILVIEAMALQ